MPRLDCPSDQELLAFHLGTAPPDALDELAAHVEGCPLCETALQRLDGTDDPVLAALRRPVPPPGRPATERRPPGGAFPAASTAVEPGALLLPREAGGPLRRRESEIRATLRSRLAALLPICGVVWGSLLVVSLTHPTFTRWYIGRPG